MKKIFNKIGKKIKFLRSYIVSYFFYKKITKFVIKSQKKNNKRISLIAIAGGLGDFIATLPIIKSIVKNEQCILLCPPHMCNYPIFFNSFNNYFSNIITFDFYGFSIKKYIYYSRLKKLFCNVCIDKLYRVGPVTTSVLESIIKGFVFAKKYTYISQYFNYIQNLSLKKDYSQLTKGTYDTFVKDFKTTYYGIQSLFSVKLGIYFINDNDDCFRVSFESNKIPNYNYFCILLNNYDDYRDPSLGLYLDLANIIIKKKNWKLVLLGNQEDNRTNFFINEFGSDNVVSYRGKTSFADYVELIRNSSFIIASDTSAAHLANAYHVKSMVFCTSMFGNTLFPYEWGFGRINQLVIQTQVGCKNCFIEKENHKFLFECRFKPLCVSSYRFSFVAGKLNDFIE